jgi:hypothetical protein
MKKIAFLLLAFSLLASIGQASAQETDVWLFYGAGPHSLSSGIDQIARKARPLAGVSRVTVLDYRSTQTAYDQVLATPSSHTVILGGYSCGSSSALVVARALAGLRNVAIIGLQPSLWCGRYETTPNIVYAQATTGTCWQTGGLGCARYQGAAQHTVLIERPQRHLQADQDPDYQRDMLFAIAAIAKPSRRHWLVKHLGRTSHYVYATGQHLRLGEGR